MEPRYDVKLLVPLLLVDLHEKLLVFLIGEDFGFYEPSNAMEEGVVLQFKELGL